jgi:CzcA family heavy metal efflux pump
MLKKLTMRAIQARYLVIACAVILMLFGFKTIPQTPMDVFPEFAPVKVEIQTEAPGLSSVETEQLITIPVEHAMNGLPQMKTLRSKSVLGLSSVVMLFEEGTSIAEARQAVQERLLLVAQKLPAVARPPVMLPPLSSLSRVLKIGLSSSHDTLAELSTKALWTVRPRLMSIPGVANVAIWGLREQELHVRFDPLKLAQHQLNASQISQQLGIALQPDGAAYLDTAQQRMAVSYDRPTLNAEDYLQLTVGYAKATPVKLGQVAEISWGHALPIGDAVVNQGDGLLLIVEKHPHANTLRVTQQIDQALRELKPALPHINVDATIFRPATFIETALHNLQSALLLGACLVAVILILFLRNFRAALISLAAIPLSLVTAVLLLSWLQVSINTMVLAGLVIALGEVVDDSIIDLENILRALRANRLLAQPKSLLKVITQASYEVRGAVIHATLIVMAVFIPVFFLPGIAGAFFKPLAYGYLLAIFASLLVALIVTPVLAYCLLKREGDQPAVVHHTAPPAWTLQLLAQPKAVIAATALLFFSMLASLPFLGSEFLPAFKETDFLMHFVERPGTSIAQMKAMSLRASQALMHIEGVRNLGAHIGRTEVADEVVGPNFGELWVSISPQADYEKTMARIQQSISGYAGIFTDVQTYLKERSKEVMSGTSASIVIRLFGSDVDTLRDEAERIRLAIADIPHLSHLKVESQALIPHIHVRLNTALADRYGVTEKEVKQALSLMTLGQIQGEVYVGQQRFNVRLVSATPARDSLQALRQISIQSPSGAVVALADVATVMVQPTQNEIKREAASRKIDISTDVEGTDIGSVAQQIESRLNRLTLPAGYYVRMLGEYTEQKTATRTLVSYSLLALLLVFLLMFMSLRSLRLTAMLFAVLPVAVAGGMIGIWLTGGVISLGAMIGLIAVLGIAARSGILLISRYQQLRHSHAYDRPVLLAMAVSDRLRAISMTTLATSMALVPIILKGPVSGYEIEYPLAVVVVCGLLSSVAVNLMLLPALILLFDQGDADAAHVR